MTHPLQDIMAESEALLLIGDSSEERFPAYSYHVYTTEKKAFHCLDLGGLSESRGKTKGGTVYQRVEDLPEERGDLAIVWMKPRSAARGVEAAHQAGCKRVWFSFGTGHPEAVARAKELGLEVLEVGRCPVYYLDTSFAACVWHTRIVKATGLWKKPPVTEVPTKRREML